MEKVSMSRVFVVVLNWNQPEDTCECLASLRQLSYPNYSTIVVDNGSVDGSPDLIADRYPEVVLIRNKMNLGFASGNNVGITAALRADADYVFLLNNDTTVDPSMISELVEVAEADPWIAAVGPQIFYYDEPDRLWFLGADVKWPCAKVAFWRLSQRAPYPERQLLDTDFLAGAGMLIRGSAIHRVGAFDPDFFIYWDDVDLCVRFAKAGYKVKALTSAHMWHKVSRAATAGKTSCFLMGRNHLYICRKHNGFRVFWLVVVPTILARQLRQMAVTRSKDNTLATFRGSLAYLRGLRGAEGI